METTRLRGRLRNKWQDKVWKEGRLVGGTGWRERVHNREEWKKLLRAGRNLHILHMPVNEWMNEWKNECNFRFMEYCSVDGVTWNYHTCSRPTQLVMTMFSNQEVRTDCLHLCSQKPDLNVEPSVGQLYQHLFVLLLFPIRGNKDLRSVIRERTDFGHHREQGRLLARDSCWYLDSSWCSETLLTSWIVQQAYTKNAVVLVPHALRATTAIKPGRWTTVLHTLVWI